MISKELIHQLVEDHLGNGSIFVTNISVGANNQISIAIDGDEGVTISDCVALSRHIEKSLDPEKNEFSLDVSSHGATNALTQPRQFKKHVGRDFEIKLMDGEKTSGILVSFVNDELTLENQVRENKPLGKGKITVTKQQKINLKQIKEAKIKLKF